MRSPTEYYQTGAANFASFFGNAKRLQLIKLIENEINKLQAELKRPLAILDVGAGTGMHANYFSKREHCVTAVEPAEAMLSEGRRLYGNQNLNLMIDSLPYLHKLANMKFDVIYSVAVWQYLKPEDRQSAMNRIAALLQPGGVIAIVWPVPMSREHQYPLSAETLLQTVEVINEKLPPEQRIIVSCAHPIPDPDSRMGVIETSKKVYFHTMLMHSPELLSQYTSDRVFQPRFSS